MEKLGNYLKAAIDNESTPAITNLLLFFPDILEQKIDGFSPFEYAVKTNKKNVLKELFPEGKPFSSPHRATEGIENMSVNSPERIFKQSRLTLR